MHPRAKSCFKISAPSTPLGISAINELTDRILLVGRSDGKAEDMKIEATKNHVSTTHTDVNLRNCSSSSPKLPLSLDLQGS